MMLINASFQSNFDSHWNFTMNSEIKKTLEVLDIPLSKIQEKSLIGSYKGVIPIRSASFSSNKGYSRRRSKSEATPSVVIDKINDTIDEASGQEAVRNELLQQLERDSVRLTRACSAKAKIKAKAKEWSDEFPASLQPLQLEAIKCPDHVDDDLKPKSKTADHPLTDSSREPTLSPALSVGESTDTLMNLEEPERPRTRHPPPSGLSLVYQQEIATPPMELTGTLMDHYTDSGKETSKMRAW